MPRRLANSPLRLMSIVFLLNFVIYVSATPISAFTISHPGSSGISFSYAGSRRGDMGKDSSRNYMGELGLSSKTVGLDQTLNTDHHDGVFFDTQCDSPSEHLSEPRFSMQIFDLVGGYSMPIIVEAAVMPKIFQSFWTRLLRHVLDISEPTSISGEHAVHDISQVPIQETDMERRLTCGSNGIRSESMKEIELEADKLLVLFNDIIY
ncbi:hypothetical protein BDP27DRAFT_1324420 [Rhodocollybia butyracea]|uniref:Uncharacterized protein n=1 Tax=Rhodocollybia butyracea TaxID=206335 RepID=A0A9P5U8Q5_9AGAR|nr:hypothetical protein BDP27DRAFT_1324420 [Rhodocollybia butyracea]